MPDQLLIACVHREMRREILLDVVNETDDRGRRGRFGDDDCEPLGIHLEVNPGVAREVEGIELTHLAAPQRVAPKVTPSTEFVFDEPLKLVISERGIKFETDGRARKESVFNTDTARLNQLIHAITPN